MFREIYINNRKCLLRQQGNGGPAIYWGTFLHEANEVEHLWDELEKAVQGKDFLLVAFFADDWNRDFSPWAAPEVFQNNAGSKDTGLKNPGFEGKGPDTLAWLTRCCIPFIDQEFPGHESRILAGYSLAGLFALWAAYETECFSGIACCSGSLWFPGWDLYAESHTIQQTSRIYLSLGGKEEKTRNQMMAVIGDRVRRQHVLLAQDPMVENCVLEWNSGGHFADSGKRLAKGIRWLLA